METVYETEQPLEEVVEETEDVEAEENADTYQELLDALQLLLQDQGNEETVAETVVESSEPINVLDSESACIATVFCQSMVVGILLVRTLLERVFV